VLSLIAILIGILFLYLEQETYEFKFKGGPPVAMASQQRSAFSDRLSCRLYACLAADGTSARVPPQAAVPAAAKRCCIAILTLNNP